MVDSFSMKLKFNTVDTIKSVSFIMKGNAYISAAQPLGVTGTGALPLKILDQEKLQAISQLQAALQTQAYSA